MEIQWSHDCLVIFSSLSPAEPVQHWKRRFQCHGVGIVGFGNWGHICIVGLPAPLGASRVKEKLQVW